MENDGALIALADCNSFFASVERALHPGLRNRPVCVLSSNDGNIVALTPEVKALGVRRGDPYFKVKDVLDRGGAAVFSGNLRLYAAMSRRVQNIMRQSVARAESYSIDEIFLYLDGYGGFNDPVELMRNMVRKIRLWTDIPVSVGIAPTKTLAKIASKFAKQYKGYRSVCLIDTEEKRRKALGMFDLSDVWGIGRRSLEKLLSLGVTTPLQFADMPEAWVRRHFSKPSLQTWMELNGVPCIDTAEMLQRGSISTSRSFGTMISAKDQLRSAVASFTASCANTLRSQGSRAASVSVYVCSNRFRTDLPQYCNMDTETLPVPSSDTIELTGAAMRALDRIYCPGIEFKKAGVILNGIVGGNVQTVLFDPVEDRAERAKLSRTLDEINHRYGLKTVRLGVEGGDNEVWKVRCDRRTPNYLTDINELMAINV